MFDSEGCEMIPIHETIEDINQVLYGSRDLLSDDEYLYKILYVNQQKYYERNKSLRFPKQAYICTSNYIKGVKQVDIAKMLNVSPNRVRNILAKAFRMLRHPVNFRCYTDPKMISFVYGPNANWERLCQRT